jgi:Fe-S-cluster containining protein
MPCAQQSHHVSLSLPADCQDCGVCCFSTLETYVRVTGDDYERLGHRASEVTHFVGNRAYLRMTDGHCASLAVDERGRFRCTVYDVRPDLCRELERGSRECAGEIATKGDRVERATSCTVLPGRVQGS